MTVCRGGNGGLKIAWLTPCEGPIYARERPRPWAQGTRPLQGEDSVVWPWGPTKTREKGYQSSGRIKALPTTLLLSPCSCSGTTRTVDVPDTEPGLMKHRE